MVAAEEGEGEGEDVVEEGEGGSEEDKASHVIEHKNIARVLIEIS